MAGEFRLPLKTIAKPKIGMGTPGNLATSNISTSPFVMKDFGIKGNNKTSSDQAFKFDPTSGKWVSNNASGNYGADNTSASYKEAGSLGELNPRPLLEAANFGMAHKKLSQLKKAQLARKNFYYNTPQLSVRPVTDLSPEILNAQEASKAQIRSEYAGSDPVMNLIGKAIATSQRTQLGNEQTAGRAAQLLQERGRFDQESRQNQQIAAEVEAKNLDRTQDFADYRTGVKSQNIIDRSNLNTSFLNQLIGNLDTTAGFEMARQGQEKENEINNLNTELQAAAMLDDYGKQASAIQEVLKKYRTARAATSIPTMPKLFSGAGRQMFSAGLLRPR